MSYPPAYPYPNITNHSGDRLHPGTTWFGGGRGHDIEALRPGVLWRVATPIGYPSVLYLFSITQPTYWMRLDGHLARYLTPIELAEPYSPARRPDWYRKFAELDCELFAIDIPTEHWIFLEVRSYTLPPVRNRIRLTVSRLWCPPEEVNFNFQRLYNEVRAALDEYEVERLQLLRKFQNAMSGREFEAAILNQPPPAACGSALRWPG